MIQASAVLITKNEERALSKTLLSLQEFKEIIVVDAESQDKTREIAKEFRARVFVRPFDNFADQKNFGIEQANCDWVFSVDADEIPDPELIGAIKKVAERGDIQEAGYKVKVRNFHFGRELCWGGQGKDWHLRFFQKKTGRFVSSIHEYVRAKGRIGYLPGSLLHENIDTVSEYLKKLVFYTELEARNLKKKGQRTSFWKWGLKPFARFIYYYFFRLGFLDGFEGFLFHALSSFYLVMKEVRLAERWEDR